MAFVTPRMSLKVWDDNQDAYIHEQLAENLLKLDVHDHSQGRGTLIGGAGIQHGSIGARHIFPGAINSISLASESVVEDTLADGSVTTSKLADGSVSVLKIQPGAITNAKLAANSVQLADITDFNTLRPSFGLAAKSEGLRALGTTAGTAAAGNDSRFNTSTSGVAADGSITFAKLAQEVINEFIQVSGSSTVAFGTANAIFDSGGWGGTTSGKAQFLLATVNHGLGKTPKFVTAYVARDANAAFSNFYEMVLGVVSTSSTQVKFSIGGGVDGGATVYYTSASTCPIVWVAIA